MPPVHSHRPTAQQASPLSTHTAASSHATFASLLQPPLVQHLYYTHSSAAALYYRTPADTLSAASIQTYHKGLEEAAAVQAHAVTVKTQQARTAALGEFEQWLFQHVQIRTLCNCISEDFLVYFTTHWRERRGWNRALGKGPALVTVNSLVSHLSRELEHFGREGAWNDRLQPGAFTVLNAVSGCPSDTWAFIPRVCLTIWILLSPCLGWHEPMLPKLCAVVAVASFLFVSRKPFN